MAELIKFRDLLNDLDAFDLEYAVYVRSKDWELDSVIAVLDPDEAENPNGREFFFKEDNSLFYALQVSVVREVIEHCVSQKPRVTEAEMLAALIFYFQHDALPC